MNVFEPALLALATQIALAPGPDSGEGGFPAIVWRLDHPGEAIAPHLVEAFGGVNVERDHPARWAREQELEFYVGHAPGRNELHLERDTPWYAELWVRYWNERDPGVLVRQPCLSEEETFEALRARLVRTLSARGGQHGLGISLGDEVGLTAWGGPLDLCASEACRRAFDAFVRGRPEWAACATGEGPAPYPDTDTTRKAWLEGDARHVGPWLARRAFHHEVVVRLLARLAADSRERSPGTPVGLFGLAGRTAFGGVGPEAILPHLDFIETYPTLDSRELLYTARGPDVRSFATVFREEGAPASPAWRVWEHWLRGGDGVILWCDRDLVADREYFESLRRAVSGVRAVRASIPAWAPAPGGAAVLHHPDSLALGWLRDALHDGPTWPKRFASYQNEHGTREVALRAVLRWLEDGGLLPGALTLEGVGAATVARFPLLVASELIVVEERELRALSEYVAAGGTLLLHGGFARYDRRGERSELEARVALERIAEGRVIELELDPGRYLAARARPASTYVEGRIGLLRGLLGAERRRDWAPRARRGGVRWLVAEQPLPEGRGRLCAAIPNGADVDRGELLEDLEVAIEGVDAAAIRWLHPRDARAGTARLPAGEALVFRLARP